MLGIVPQNRQKIAYWEILIDCFHSTMIQVECRLQKKGWGWCFIRFLKFLSSMGSRHAHGSSRYARTISRHADGISRYSVPASAGPLLPLCLTVKVWNSLPHLLLIFGRPYYRSSLWYSMSSVCLSSVCRLSSVTFCIVAKRCVLVKKCLKE